MADTNAARFGLNFHHPKVMRSNVHQILGAGYGGRR
jgi:hypothetical protein